MLPVYNWQWQSRRSVHTSWFQDWKHATGKCGILVRHNTCFTHKQAMLSWNDFTKNAKVGMSVANRLDSARKQQIQHKTFRHYLSTIAEVILLCGCQDVALEGILSLIYLRTGTTSSRS